MKEVMRMVRKMKRLDIYTNKSNKFLVGWQKRYFTLKSNRLWYTKSEGDEVSKGIFNFKKINASTIVDPENKNWFSLFIEGLKREFKLKAESESERNSWVIQINKSIDKCKSKGDKDTSIVKEKEFWKKCEKVPFKTFLEKCDSGDILLFKSKKLGKTDDFFSICLLQK